jgi:biofilm PGA synthesis N-glycosyltransferase PgaC
MPKTPESRILLITPVRDEERYIGPMIESLVTQDLPPAKWIIVDDGSVDDTRDIVIGYARRYPFISLLELSRGKDERKPGGEGAVAQALRTISLVGFDFVARFDADLIFSPTYLSDMARHFHLEPALGIAGGGLYIVKDSAWQLEKCPEYHVRGAVKMYRRSCFEQIGTLSSRIGWDTADEVMAWSKGWTTRSFFEYQVIHRRPTGSGLRFNKISWERGKAEYYTCSHPLFVLVKTVKLTCEHRTPVAPLFFLGGFVWLNMKREERTRDISFLRTRRNQQLDRMGRTFTNFMRRCMPVWGKQGAQA